MPATSLPPARRESRVSTPPEAPAPEAPASEVEPSGVIDTVEKVARKVAGFAVGLVFGTSGLLVNASAGGAEGIVHGARLKSHQQGAFKSAFTANLALTSALGAGPVGVVVGTLGGHLMWHLQGQEVRDRVTQGADAWVDKVLSALPGDPEQAGLGRRAVNGAIGEVVGGAAGVVKGTFGLFKAGQATGEAFVTRTAERLRRPDSP